MPDLTSLLHTTFGHKAFRANQEAVCRAATDGRDCLLVMPTGAGKSLCYQLPAIARGGTALVVSPLIALMDDQASKLSNAGLRVARIHSGLSREDSRQACRDYLDGKLQFLFIAPERMRVPGFPEMLARRKPSLIAIDEAHCISAWGHDFRPDYRTLGDFLPALRPAPIIALTATATPTVQRDIATQLNLHQPALFIHGFRRDNLHIEVLELSKPRRTEFTANFLKDPARRPAIVYAPSRKAAEEIATELNRTLRKSVAPSQSASALEVRSSVEERSALRRQIAAPYHAGLDPATRERVQTQFLAGKLEVVVATIAFGMGIDKADVRTVIHYALPASVEAFYQEIGRAGRDGLPARTVLLYSFADKKMHEFFLERDYPVLTDLSRVANVLAEDFQPPDALRSRLKIDADTFARALEKLASQGAAQTDFSGNVRRGPNPQWQSGYTQQVDFRRNQIDRMLDFAQTQQCRMSALIRHFGDTADAHRPCGHCDFCNPSAATAQILAEPTVAQDRELRTILRALEGNGKSTGRLHTELALHKDRKVTDQLLEGLARAGLITLTTETFTNPEGNVIPYKKAALTHEGRQVEPAEPLRVLLSPEPIPAPSKKKARVPKLSRSPAATEVGTNPLTPAQKALETSLRAWRKAEAAKTGKPAFIVFGDSALAALARANPQTIPELLTVSGFGPDKADRYGAALIAICRNESQPAAAARLPSLSNCSIVAEVGSKPSPRRSTTQPETFTRPRLTPASPADTLSPDQQNLESRLREWRKSESERMGLPQFFVLGTSALRTIVLERPRTVAQLRSIPGLDPEKLQKFGPALLALTNA